MTTGKAQKIKAGFHLGTNISGYTGGKHYIVYDKSSKLGLEIGADIKYLLKNRISVLSGANLLQTGGKFSVMSGYVNTSGNGQTQFPEVSTKALSIEVPLKIGYDIEVCRQTSLIPQVGVFGRYGITSKKEKISIAGYNDTYDWNCFNDFNKDMHHIDGMTRLEYGVSIGLGMKIADHYSLSLNYRKGLNDVSKQYDIQKADLSFAVGYVF